MNAPKGFNGPKRKEPRYKTSIVVDIFLNNWNPFSKTKGIVLDISWHGFQLEFINKVKIKQNQSFTIKLPLAQYNIEGPPYLKVGAIAKWYDENLHRAGGVFTEHNAEKTKLLEKLIQKLAKMKQTEEDLYQGSRHSLKKDPEKAS